VGCSGYDVSEHSNSNIGVGAGNLLWVQKILCPNLPEELLCDKFSVVVGSLYFPVPSCHRLENRKVGT